MKAVLAIALACLLAGCALFEEKTTKDGSKVVRVKPAVEESLVALRELVRTVSPPFAGAVTIVAAILGAIARRKSRNLAAVIVGVEKAATNADVKRSIQTEATLRGVQTRLHRDVNRLTRPRSLVGHK